jgi:hypothetical protein
MMAVSADVALLPHLALLPSRTRFSNIQKKANPDHFQLFSVLIDVISAAVKNLCMDEKKGD